jgi:hypothetical protein
MVYSYACAHARARACTRISTHFHAQTAHINARTCMLPLQASANMRRSENSTLARACSLGMLCFGRLCAYVFAYAHVCKCVCARTCIWVGGCTSACMIACVYVFFWTLHLSGCTGARACVLDCVHTRCHAQICAREHKHAHARTHTRTPTHLGFSTGNSSRTLRRTKLGPPPPASSHPLSHSISSRPCIYKLHVERARTYHSHACAHTVMFGATCRHLRSVERIDVVQGIVHFLPCRISRQRWIGIRSTCVYAGNRRRFVSVREG